MQHLQRIADPLHVEPRDRPPRAPDEEQPRRPAPAPPRRSALTPLRIALSRLSSSAMSASCSGPSGEVRAGGIVARVDPRQLHRGAAHVADQPLGVRPAEQHPLRRQPRLLRPLATCSCNPVSRSIWSQKAGPSSASRTAAVATAIIPDSSIRAGQRREAVQGRPRPLPALGAEPPGVGQPGPEAAEHLLVVEIGRASRHAVEDDEADGIGPDVDDPDPLQPRLGGVLEAGPRHRFIVPRCHPIPPRVSPARGPEVRTRSAKRQSQPRIPAGPGAQQRCAG